MRTLTPREKRTLAIAAVAITLYLALFFGWRGWKQVEVRRAEYLQLLGDGQRLRRELQVEENRVLLAQKLKETFRLDPRKLSRASLVADASAAIQRAATSAGIQLGPMRETPARSSNKELASMSLEGVGAVPAVMTLLHRLQSLGYPLIVDSVQLTPDPTKPGKLKLNLTIVILDFDQWKKEEAPRA